MRHSSVSSRLSPSPVHGGRLKDLSAFTAAAGEGEAILVKRDGDAEKEKELRQDGRMTCDALRDTQTSNSTSCAARRLLNRVYAASSRLVSPLRVFVAVASDPSSSPSPSRQYVWRRGETRAAASKTSSRGRRANNAHELTFVSAVLYGGV